MKKISLLLAIVLILTCCLLVFCGCESREERAYKSAVNAANAASNAASKAQSDYNDLKNRLNDLEKSYDRLE